MELVITTLRSRKDIEVIGKKYHDRILPLGYANNTQAQKKADGLGPDWGVYRGLGRPFFVGRKRVDSRVWSEGDNETACKQGWAIFNAKTHPEIQRLDEEAGFATDADALTFVKKNAATCTICAKALALVGIPV